MRGVLKGADKKLKKQTVQDLLDTTTVVTSRQGT